MVRWGACGPQGGVEIGYDYG